MNTVQRIAKNTGVLLVSQIVSYIIGFFFIMYTARYLGVGGFGILSFALVFTGIFGVFSDLGLSTLTVREAARDKFQASKYLNNVLCLRALISLVIFAIIVITINVMGYPADTKNVVHLFGIYMLVTSFAAVFKVTFRAFEKMILEDVSEGERVLL